MKSIKERIKEGWKKQRSKSFLNQLSDIFFVLLVIAMLIPSTRRELSAFIIRLTMTQPATKTADAGNKMTDGDYAWMLRNTDGENFSLNDFKGQVIFLNFWATWCPPCRAEMPGIQELYNEYKDKVRFILVSNENRDVITTFLSSKSFQLPAYMPVYQTPQIFESNSIPTTFIISRDGEVVLKDVGAKKWDGQKIKSLLDNLIKQ